MRNLVGLVLLGLAGPASAQTFGASQVVLTPNASIPFASQSVGAPTVVYDSNHDKYFMIFEARTPTTDNRCPQGVWALGIAQSNDGINWSMSSTPVIMPSPGDGSFYSCVSAHPGALFAPGTAGKGKIYVYFKGEQDTDACLTGVSPWGCGTYTGVGKATISLNAAGFPTGVTVRTNPVVSTGGQNFGYPKVVRESGTFWMSVTKYPSVYMATSPDLNNFTMNPNPVLVPSDYPTVPWVKDEFFSSALLCKDAPDNFPLQTFVGGRDTDFGIVKSGGLGKAISANGTLWTLAATALWEWNTDTAYRHWDVLRVGVNDVLMWFDDKDGSGNNRISFKDSVGGTWNNVDVYDKSCN